MYQEANFKVSSLDSLVSAGTQGRVVLSWEKALLNPLTRSLSRAFGLLITFKRAGKFEVLLFIFLCFPMLAKLKEYIYFYHKRTCKANFREIKWTFYNLLPTSPFALSR